MQQVDRCRSLINKPEVAVAKNPLELTIPWVTPYIRGLLYASVDHFHSEHLYSIKMSLSTPSRLYPVLGNLKTL